MINESSYINQDKRDANNTLENIEPMKLEYVVQMRVLYKYMKNFKFMV